MRSAALFALFLTCAPTQSSDTPRPPSTAPANAKTDFDIRIVGGEVIDGTGRARFRADVGIRGDAIAAIGDLSRATAKTTIDAKGLVVAPGFIDLNGHSEGPVLIDPKLEGKVRQGVTTEVTGEGHSPGPINEPMAAEMNRTRPPGFPEVTWRSLGEYMQFVEKRGSAINFALWLGATNPREIVIGDAERDPTPEELKRMEAIADQAMQEGAVGVCSALIYPPGRFAKTEELIALTRVGYWTHLRNEADRIDAALDEAFRIAREAKVPLNILHLKTGGSMKGRMAEVIAKIEAARKGGLDVAANVYPYTATSTDLTSIVPAWALQGGYLQFVARVKDPATRPKIAEALRTGDGSTILVRSVPNGGAMMQYERKRLDAIAKAMNTNPQEAALRLFEAASASPVAIYFNLSDDDMKLALKQPWVSLGSDSGAVVGTAREKGAHPRAYGTFTRVLGRYVRDDKLFTLEEAVRKVTSLAASRVPLEDRGILAVGMKADVVVFDPKTIRDVSTYEDPHHFSEGVHQVIVNGVPILRDGKMTGALPGRILRRAATASSRP